MRTWLGVAVLLVLCGTAWAARPLRVFGPAGFEDGDPLHDCPADAVGPSGLEAKFLRRTGATVVCMQASPTVCVGNTCGGNPGCPAPIGPPISAFYRIDQDRVDTQDRINRFTFPAEFPLVGTCTVTIDPGNVDLVVNASHFYDVQNFGLDGLAVVSHLSDPDPTVTGLTSSMVGLSGSFACAMIDVGLGFFVGTLQDLLGPPVVELQHAETSDVPGTIVCPVIP